MSRQPSLASTITLSSDWTAVVHTRDPHDHLATVRHRRATHRPGEHLEATEAWVREQVPSACFASILDAVLKSVRDDVRQPVRGSSLGGDRLGLDPVGDSGGAADRSDGRSSTPRPWSSSPCACTRTSGDSGACLAGGWPDASYLLSTFPRGGMSILGPLYLSKMKPLVAPDRPTTQAPARET